MPASIRTQIVEQTRGAIWYGLLPPGHRLPTHRELAERLGVSSATVREAFRELRELGVVEAREREGMFVVRDLPGGAHLDALPHLVKTLGMRKLAAGYRAGLQAEGEERACREGEFTPWVRAEGGKGPLKRERQWVGIRFRQAVRMALRAGMSLEGMEEVYRAAVEWEVRPR